MTQEMPEKPPALFRGEVEPVSGCRCCACRQLRGESVEIPREVSDE